MSIAEHVRQANSEIERYRGAVEFNCIVRHMLAARGYPLQAANAAEADGACPMRVREILKAAVTTGSLADGNWASTLGAYRQTIASYVDALSSVSFFDRALADGSFVRVPPRTPIAVVTTAIQRQAALAC